MKFGRSSLLLGLTVFLLAYVALPGAAGKRKKDPGDLLHELTLEEKVGQLLMAKVLEGPEGEPDDRTRQLVQELGVGSVLFYSFPDPGATARYTNELQGWAEESSAGLPLLVGSDLEYGLKANVGGGVTPLPQQMGLGATREPKLARRAAAITAEEGRSMGIHWNFAPTADVNTNPKNPVIGVRSFGSNPELVSSFVSSAVQGYQDHGMVATLKHYPGHGDTATDSHYGLPKVTYGEEELEKHLKPFRAGIEAGADAVMTAHILVDSVDPELPATLSKEVITDLLRDQGGFEGVVVTDAMNMEAIEENFGKVEAAVKAVKAGADVVMSAGNYWDALEVRDGLVEAVESGRLSVSRVDESVKRILELKKDYGLLQGDNHNDPEEAERVAGREENLASAVEMAREAVTVVRDERGLIPLREEASKVTLVGVKDSVDLLKEELAALLPESEISTYRTPGASRYNDWSPSDSGIEEAAKAASEADRVILLTYSGGRLPEGQRKLIRELTSLQEGTIVIEEGLPYGIGDLPGVSAYIATYAYNRWNAPSDGHRLMAQATAEVLVGEVEAGGRLPIGLGEE